MATHKLTTSWEVLFEDGTTKMLEPPERVYHFREQRHSYLVRWLEQLIDRYGITSKPVEIREVMKVTECEPYQITIGL